MVKDLRILEDLQRTLNIRIDGILNKNELDNLRSLEDSGYKAERRVTVV